MNRYLFPIWVIVCSIALSNGSPAFAPIQENEQFRQASTIANDQIIAVNEAAGQKVFTPPEEQEGVLRLGISPTPSVTPSPSITPTPSVTPTPSPSVTPSPSASVTPSSTPSRTPNPSQSSAPKTVECPVVYVDGEYVPESEMENPNLLTRNKPSLVHYGDEASLCRYFVNVPKNAETYTATVTADGDADLYVAFEDYPMSTYSDGVQPECYSASYTGNEKCYGSLRGNEIIYLKLEGFDAFTNGVINVSFDLPPSPSPSPDPSVIDCPVMEISTSPLEGDGVTISNYAPVELPANTPVSGHAGEEGSVCSYYVDVPNDSVTYEATLNASGDADLYVAFDDEPETYYTSGVEPVCGSASSSGEEYCAGDLEGNTRVFVKLEGWYAFTEGTLAVRFDVPYAQGTKLTSKVNEKPKVKKHSKLKSRKARENRN